MKLSHQILLRRADKVPKGWVTSAQLAEQEGLAAQSGGFYYVIRAAISAGLLEKKIFLVPCGNSLRQVAHFKRIPARR